MNGVKSILKGELKVFQSQISDKMDRIWNAVEKNVEEKILEQEKRIRNPDRLAIEQRDFNSKL